jgi:hypothetical protein
MEKLKTTNGFIIAIGLLALVFMMAGCANKEVVATCLKGQTYGFWYGLWHGIIAPVDLVLMLFRSDITVYATNNNGAWYAFGFIIGSGGWGFFGGNRASKTYKKKEAMDNRFHIH